MKKFLSKRKIPKKLVRPLAIAKILMHDMNRCDLFKHASAMAYVTLFSLIPSLAAVFALISLFKPFLGEEGSIYNMAKDFILQNLAAGSGEQVVAYIESFIQNLNLTKIGITGFAGTIVTLVLLLRQIEIALNRIWLVKKERNILTRFIYFWTFLTFGTFVIGIAIGVISGFNFSALNPFGDTVNVTVGHGIRTFVTTFLSTFLFFMFIYKIVPNCYVSYRDAFFGALPATILFYIGSQFFGLYTSSFTNYAAVYGALAAVPVFLLWLYVLWLITLLGSLLSWRSQQGFAMDDDMDEDKADITAREKYRNNELQLALPFLITLMVYHRFLEGAGKGVAGTEISTALNFPAPWVSDALEVLLDLGLIVAGSDAKGEISGDPLQNAFFPTTSPDKITLDKLFAKLGSDAGAWLKEWKHDWPVNIKSVVETVWRLEAQCLPKTTIAEVLKKLPQGA